MGLLILFGLCGQCFFGLIDFLLERVERVFVGEGDYRFF